MLNHIVLQGRLTKDVELRHTQTDKAVASFSIAVDRGGNNGTDFINCTAWQQTAEFVYKHFNKGDMILLEGRLQQRTWEDNNGNKRTAHDVVVSSVNFCGGKKNEAKPTPDVQFEELLGDESDLPF